MTQDEIITLAREAGFKTESWTNSLHISVYANGVEIGVGDKLERFAALVAARAVIAADREKIVDKEMDWDSALERHDDRVNREVTKQNQASGVMHHENQEPIGEVVFDDIGIGNAQVVRLQMFKRIPPVGTKLYTHPVRTKDLTDDEILDVVRKTLGVNDERFEFQGGRILTIRESELLPTSRAVIAADREKNK